MSDGLGSVSEALNQTGTASGIQLYSPYGTVRYSSGVMPTAKGFTGQYSDAATSGLDYYGARYYDPQLGQFTSADTVTDGLNRYGYVKGNPETYTDPTGHRQCMDDTACRFGSVATNTVLQTAGLHAALWARYLRNSGQEIPRTTTVTRMKKVSFPDHNLPGGKPREVEYPTTETTDNSPKIWQALRDSERFNRLGWAVAGVGAVMDAVIAGHDYADAHPNGAAWKPYVYGLYHSLVATGITLGVAIVGDAFGPVGIIGAAVVTTVAAPLIDSAADSAATFVVNSIQDTGNTLVKEASDYATSATADLPIHIEVNFGPVSFTTGTESSWP